MTSNTINDIKLIVCDIDHTLVVKHQMLSQRAKNVIQLLHKHGIYFGIASGRSLEEIKRIVKRWDLNTVDFIIGMNGSILYDTYNHQEYSYFKLKKEWIKEIMGIMTKFPCNPLIYDHDTMLCRELDEVVKASCQSAEMKPLIAKNDSDFYQHENAKIMFRVHENQMEAIEYALNQHKMEHYHAFKTQSTLIEFCDSRVSKAYALEKFCELNTISLKEVMAFGDTSNDNTMLEISGIGVCMKNGSEDTKAIADMITEKNCAEDGWADFMETNFISKRGWKYEE